VSEFPFYHVMVFIAKFIVDSFLIA